MLEAISTITVVENFWTSENRLDCGCFPACVWTAYDVDMSQSPFPADYYWKLIDDRSTSDPEHMVHDNATK